MADVTVDHQGRIRLPKWALDKLGARGGKKLRIRSEGDRVILERISAVDPFADAFEKPAPDAMEKLMDEQARDKSAAENRFEELLENPPEVRPEDNEDLWR